MTKTPVVSMLDALSMTLKTLAFVIKSSSKTGWKHAKPQCFRCGIGKKRLKNIGVLGRKLTKDE